jgi:hypothetical protein
VDTVVFTAFFCQSTDKHRAPFRPIKPAAELATPEVKFVTAVKG